MNEEDVNKFKTATLHTESTFLKKIEWGRVWINQVILILPFINSWAQG